MENIMVLTTQQKIRLTNLLNKNTPNKPDTECWDYGGSKGLKGYGLVKTTEPLGNGKYKQVYMYAHRLSYENYYGDLDDDLHVCHECDNPSCVNPLHLFKGTDDDNHKDKVKKNRQLKGEEHGNSRFTEEQIRDWKYSNESAYSIGKMNGIDPSYIYGIRNGKYWKHI